MRKLVFGMIVALGCLPTVAFGQATAPAETPDPVTDAQQYDAPVQNADPDKPLIPSFLKRSGTKAGGPANELNTGDGRATQQLPEGSAIAAVTGKSLYHGNYCGYGNRGYDKPPVDALDAACMQHDRCFDQTNRSCSCNAALKVEAYKVAELKSASRELRTRAASVVESIGGMSCN